MNHQPFNDWLLSDEILSSDQAVQLETHMQSCDSCRQTKEAWENVETTFHRAPEVGPAPGFTARWQAHLVEYQERKKKYRAWMVIGVNALIILSLLIVLTVQIYYLIQSPGPYLVQYFSQLIGLVSIYYTVNEFFHSFSVNLSFYSFLGTFALVGIVSFMSVFWLATYRKLSTARRRI